jgi:hypothetical protein
VSNNNAKDMPITPPLTYIKFNIFYGYGYKLCKNDS